MPFLTPEERKIFNHLRHVEKWPIIKISLEYDKPQSTVQECVSGNNKPKLTREERVNRDFVRAVTRWRKGK